MAGFRSALLKPYDLLSEEQIEKPGVYRPLLHIRDQTLFASGKKPDPERVAEALGRALIRNFVRPTSGRIVALGDKRSTDLL